MADLASAIVTLATASEHRWVARARLAEAVETVAHTIASQMDPDEQITVDGSTYTETTVTWFVSQWANNANAFLHPKGDSTLCRNGKALFSPHRDSYFDGNNRHSPCVGDHDGLYILDEDLSVPLASPEEMVAFADEAATLINLLARRAESDASKASDAAEHITRLAPR